MARGIGGRDESKRAWAPRKEAYSSLVLGVAQGRLQANTGTKLPIRFRKPPNWRGGSCVAVSSGTASFALKKKEAGIPVSGLSNRSPDGTRWYPKEGIGGPGPFSVFPFCPSEPSTAFPRLAILLLHRFRRIVRHVQQTLRMKPKRLSRRAVCA